jgi:PPM family protein phosphatase
MHPNKTPCTFHGLTDVGRVRTNNEDAIAIEADVGLAVLADGMGGYKAGEVASAMATSLVSQRLRDWLSSPQSSAGDTLSAVQASVQAANLAIFEAARSRTEYEGMGTTLVLLLLQDQGAVIGHVGDARAYRLREGQLTPLTRDHSLLQEQVDAGLVSPEWARLATYRNIVTRAVGVEPMVRLDLAEYEALPGDLFLLCSDGLHDMLTDERIATLLRQAPTLPEAAQALVDAANEAGGRDNIAVILAQCEDRSDRCRN